MLGPFSRNQVQLSMVSIVAFSGAGRRLPNPLLKQALSV
jgi:hypothetical protein